MGGIRHGADKEEDVGANNKIVVSLITLLDEGILGILIIRMIPPPQKTVLWMGKNVSRKFGHVCKMLAILR